jgi:hypothetical protein
MRKKEDDDGKVDDLIGIINLIINKVKFNYLLINLFNQKIKHKIKSITAHSSLIVFFS